MSRIPSFKDLQVWQKMMTPIVRLYECTREYPDEEKYGLIAETRKTARSVASNIAEGKMRLSPKEFRNFISIALGSVGELETQVLLAGRLEDLSSGVTAELEEQLEEIGRMLRGLERALS